MWIGVPDLRSCWRDELGCWIINVGSRKSTHLRLSPSFPEDEVQYGYCPIRINCQSELIEKEFPGGVIPRVANSMVIGNHKDSLFRVDRMIVGATSLLHPKDTTPSGVEFRRLLGKTSLSSFIEDMMRGLYRDSPYTQDVTLERDENYRTMLFLVAGRAYPGFTSPSTKRFDWSRLRHISGNDGHRKWDLEVVRPMYYNIVMPQALLEVVSKNLERGIPPLVPQYFIQRNWMFNGPPSEPCTGLPRNIMYDTVGDKITAGVINRFNLDLPGVVSYWPSDLNPPDEWLNKAIECAETLGESELPLGLHERQDLSLQESRKVPAVRFLGSISSPILHFSVITSFEERDDGSHNLEINDCDSSGQLLSAKEEAVDSGEEVTYTEEATKDVPNGPVPSKPGECAVPGRIFT
jgi:hypothetical protein